MCPELSLWSRTWDAIREDVAKKYRFIAYTQRYFGTGPRHDDGKGFSVATHADDLAKFIAALDARPVHVVGWSYGGQVAATAAVQQPSLIRSLILYEPGVISVLPPDSVEGKAAREERSQVFALPAAASKSGEHIRAVRLLLEAVFRLPPGGFEQEPQASRTMWEENARTVPLTFGAPPPPPITCEMLHNLGTQANLSSSAVPELSHMASGRLQPPGAITCTGPALCADFLLTELATLPRGARRDRRRPRRHTIDDVQSALEAMRTRADGTLASGATVNMSVAPVKASGSGQR